MLLSTVFAVAAATAGAVQMSQMSTPADTSAASLTMTIDSSHKEVVLTVGPFDLPDRSGEDIHAHHGAGHDTPVYHFNWPIDGWLRGFRIEVVDGEGTVLPRRIMHHMIMVNFDRRQLIYHAAERLLGAGSETADYVLPKTIGVPVTPGSDLGMYIAWHNDTGAPIEGAYLRMSMVWTPKNQVPQPLATLPVYFDVNLEVGGTNTFDIPAGQSSKTYDFTVPVGGRLLGVSGHLHDYGERVQLQDATTGKVLAEVEASVDKRGRIEGMERKLFGVSGRGLKLEANHPYRVVGMYNNPTGHTIELGAMASMVGIFAPDDLGDWPQLDPADPMIKKDLASLSELSGQMMQMHHTDDPDDEGHAHEGEHESHDDHKDDHDH